MSVRIQEPVPLAMMFHEASPRPPKEITPDVVLRNMPRLRWPGYSVTGGSWSQWRPFRCDRRACRSRRLDRLNNTDYV